MEQKIVPKSFQKQLSNQHQTWIDFAPNLAPFWEVFGGQDGAKFAPRCLQDGILGRFELQVEAQNEAKSVPGAIRNAIH